MRRSLDRTLISFIENLVYVNVVGCDFLFCLRELIREQYIKDFVFSSLCG